MRSFFHKIKRKIAAVLVVVLSMQTILGGGPLSLSTAYAGQKNRVDLETALPEQEAFEELYVETGTAVSGTGDTLSMRFHFKLNHAWIEDKLYEYIDGGLADPGDFDSPAEYDEYLESRDDGELEPLSFTCTVADGVLDVPEIRQYLEENPEIYTTKGEKIGIWSVENGLSGPVFRVTLDKKVYNRMSVMANRGLEAKLLERFQPGDTVEAGKGSGDVDLTIRIDGEGEPVATSSDYVIEKTAESGADTGNADGNTDPSAINYTVSVRASASNAEGSSLATNSGWAALASPNTVQHSPATDSGWDDEDEILFDERDGDLVFDWWNFSVPMKSVRVNREAAEAAGIDLAGKHVTDSISSDLNLDAVEISFDEGESWERLDAKEVTGYDSWEMYLEDHNRMFTYQIPAQDEGAVVAFDIRFYTRISNELWHTYGETGKLDREFPNKAILKGEDGTTTLAVSNLVKPSIHWESLISKEGVPLDVNGNVYQWQIQVDAHFSDGVKLYLIDHIKDIHNTHQYILDGEAPVRIESDGGPDRVLEVERLTAEEPGEIEGKTFEELTITDVETLLGDRFEDGKVYVYEYSYKENDIEKTDQIMLIPLAGYTNGNSTITYETDISAAKQKESLEYDVKVANEVKPVWRWDGGLGPGTEPFGTITVRKNYEIQVNTVGKTGAGYDPVTNTITWEFDVNQRGIALDRVLIIDNLNKVTGGHLEWSGLVAEKSDIPLIRTDRKPVKQRDSAEARSISYVEPEAWKVMVNINDATADTPGDYYTVVDQKLKVRLDSMAAEEYYKFRVETSVLDGSYAQHGGVKIINNAAATVTAGGKSSKPMKIPALITIAHSLISKHVESFGEDGTAAYLYNYEDNTVKWRIKVNPDSREITGAVITDTLPLGTTFARLISAKKGTEEVDVPEGSRTVEFSNGVQVNLTIKENTEAYPKTSTGEYSKDTVTFTFNQSIKDPYEFVFTTTVDENFRKEIVKSTGTEGETLCNHVKLDGTIGGVEITNASACAENKILPKPLMKEGRYHGLSQYTYYEDPDDTVGRKMEAVWFEWTAYVNRTGADMQGVRIRDTLEECFELVPTSVNVDAVTLDARGNVTGEANRIIEKGRAVKNADTLTDWKHDERGFDFVIPEAFKNSTLRITFDTVLVDDAAVSQMVNTIYAEGNGWSDRSDQATDDQAMDFTLSDYATAEGMIYLRVLKSSSNQSSGKLYLKGAEFSLQKMKLKSGGNKETIDGWELTGSRKVRATRANGALSFLFLQPDTMYCLRETKAPAGYQREEKTWYIVAKVSEQSITDFPEEAITGDYQIIVNQESNSLTHEVYNAPDVSGGTNELRFVKTGQNGQILPGTKFQIRGLHQSWTAEANEKGVVSFDNLDPLEKDQYYTMRETTPVGYRQSPVYYVSVTLNEHGAYELKLLDQNKKEVTDKIADPDKSGTQIYEVKNEPIQKDGSFVKVNQNQELLKAEEVTFAIYRRGDGGKIKGNSHTVVMDPEENGTEYYKYLPQQTATSTNGIVELKNLYYGYYRLDETVPAAESSILEPEQPVSIYIKVDKNGSKALPLETVDPEHAKDSQYTLNLDGRNQSGSLVVSNTQKWGLVQVNKVVGHYDGKNWVPELSSGAVIPMQDALFGVYVGEPQSDPEKLYMRLKTDENGRFLMADKSRYQIFDEAGRQTGTKVLLCGTYYLKELSAPDHYITDAGRYPFEIVAGTGDSMENYEPAPVVYVNSEADVPENAAVTVSDTYFLNKPVRQPVEIIKTDADYPGDIMLNHAQFHVYVKDGNQEYAVAELNSTGGGGTYTLAPLKDSGCDVCAGAKKVQNEKGEHYLEKESASQDSPYLLLHGTYIIRETTAPYIKEGDHFYPLDQNTMYAELKVTADGFSLSAGNGTLDPSGNTVKNRVKHGTVKLTKEVMMLENPGEATGSYQYVPVSGFRFQLSGHPAQSLPEHKPLTKLLVTGSQGNGKGEIVFEGIPIGTYILTETDVPKKYKDSDGNWLIRKAPDVWVEISPAEGQTADATVVSYYAVEKDQNQRPVRGQELTGLSGETPQNDSGVCLQGDGPSQSLRIYNALKLTNMSGTKLAAGKSDGQTAVLPGAEFTLKHETLKAANGDPCEFKSTTNDKGELQFANIPYGPYKLEETGVPAGYEKMNTLTFTITDDNVQENTYFLTDDQGQSLLRDNVIMVNARFQKLDQSGNAVPHEKLNAQFKVVKTEKTTSAADFWPEGGAVVPTDENGYLVLENLSYGVYAVSETLDQNERDKLDSGAELVKFWMEVKGSEDKEATTISVYGDEQRNQLLAESEVASNGTADFTNAGSFPEMAKQMTNILRHGSIQINKVGGDAAGGSGHNVTVPLAGATFEIYRNDEADPYLTLVTDMKGNFPEMEPGGFYPDADGKTRKVLYAGTYTLKEVSTADGYQVCDQTAEFHISDRGEVVFIGYDGKTVTAATRSNAEAADIKFYNIPERGRLEFVKRDSDTGKELDGAVFLAYQDERMSVPVAFVSQSMKGATYQIVGDSEQVAELKTRYSGEIRGWSDTIDGIAAVSGNDQDGYGLKTGTYYLKEIKAPDDYVIPPVNTNKIPVVIQAGETAVVHFGRNDGVANTIIKANLEFTKKIETSAYRPEDKAEGFTFILKGTSSNAVTEEPWSRKADSDHNGSFSFADVPVGVYTLYECDEAADTRTDQYEGFAPGAADAVAVLSVTITGNNGLAEVSYDKAGHGPVEVQETTLTNKLKLGSIAGKKVASENNEVGLKDAYIGIYRTRDDARSGNNPVTVVRSGDDGEFRFEQVPYGTYYIREKKAPYGYAPGTAIFRVTIREAGAEAVKTGINVEHDEAAKEETEIVFANGNKRGDVILRKLASPSDAVLTDAEFTVYASYVDGDLDVPVAYLKYQPADKVYKLADGEGLTGHIASRIPYLQRGENGEYYLIQGHYWVAETTVPDGYRTELDGEKQKVYPVTISGSGEEQQIPTVEITNDGQVFYNDLMTGGFTIRKTIEVARPGVSEPDLPAAGAGFLFRIEGMTDEAAGKGTPVSGIETIRIDGKNVDDASNAVADGDALVVTAGADGRVQISGLPVGTYTVTEVDGPDIELYTGTKSQTVVVSQNDSQTELEMELDGRAADPDNGILSFHNALKRYRVEGRKTDEKRSALAGVTFGLWSEDGETLYQETVTDSEGRFAFEKLPTGNYVVKETTASAEDYVVDHTTYPVTITSGMEPSEPVLVSSEPIVNVLKRGFVEIEKTDPENPDHIFTEVSFTLYAEDGTRIAGMKQEEDRNRFVLASPSDAVYRTDDKGDCYLVWDDRVQKTALIYGDYYIQETDAESGYLVDLDGSGNPLRHWFSIVEDGKTIMLSNNGTGDFENRRAKGRLTIRKEKEVAGANVFGESLDKVPGEGFTFRISYKDTTAGQSFGDADIRSFAVVDRAGAAEPGSGENPWLEVTTGADGSVILSELLAGEYTITEIRRSPQTDAYVLPAVKTFTVEVDQRDNTVTKEEVTFINLLKRSRIEGLKTNASGQPLAGAEIGLFPADTVDFTEENLFYERKAVSGEDGVFVFENIPYGTYRVAELKAPSGYNRNTRTSYLVNVTEDGTTVGAGIPEDKGNAAGTDPAAIVIVNTRKSGGGSGGGDKPGPVNPTDPTNPGPGVETEPSTEATAPEAPTDPAGEILPTDPAIPFDPENPVIDIPGNPPRVEIVDEDDNTVYEGPGSNINIGDWKPGNYTVYTFDDQDVPLGTMTFTINDEGVPLAFMLPKTGDSTLPYALLAAIMLGALGGMAALSGRRRKERR